MTLFCQKTKIKLLTNESMITLRRILSSNLRSRLSTMLISPVSSNFQNGKIDFFAPTLLLNTGGAVVVVEFFHIRSFSVDLLKVVSSRRKMEIITSRPFWFLLRFQELFSHYSIFTIADYGKANICRSDLILRRTNFPSTARPSVIEFSDKLNKKASIAQLGETKLMSSSEDDNDIPDDDVCLLRTDLFGTVTGTNAACGQFYLQDCKWDLTVAINRYFDQPDNARLPPWIRRMVSQDKDTVKTMHFSILSWNLDGLDNRNIVSRVNAACDEILELEPSVLFFQEVVPENFEVLKRRLGEKYQVLENNDRYYYHTSIFIHRTNLECTEHHVVDFARTSMNRNMFIALIEFDGDVQLCLVNSHLESGRKESRIRKSQLEEIWSLMAASPDDVTVFFGGDTNLGFGELKAVPANVTDLFQDCGSPVDACLTWDPATNANLNIPKRCRQRFDRIFVKASKPARFKPIEFSLVGKKLIRSSLCHPSDHYGIYCKMEKIENIEPVDNNEEK
ncbi:Tyrosyl-DNA phosphodiesterase 2 [Trichinella sp. T9]|nr:Tyrosyl-DNA phosphodiesterase 2 [Trichinella sp. T9]